MPRAGVHVRPATADDLPLLLELDGEVREAAAKETLRINREARYAEALADPTRRVLIATSDTDEALGMALLVRGSASALFDLPAVHLSHFVVADRHRRKGAGRALVAAAASYAEEIGADHVVVSVTPTSRDANRFFARLGFAPLVIRRVAPLAVVRRRLAEGVVRPAETTGPLPVVTTTRRRRGLSRRLPVRLGEATSGDSQPF